MGQSIETPYKFYVMLKKPEELLTSVDEFDCQPLNAESCGTLTMTMTFDMKAFPENLKHGMLMMRILDGKNVIMGDSRQDNLLVLFRRIDFVREENVSGAVAGDCLVPAGRGLFDLV